jgi:hypothetical protein
VVVTGLAESGIALPAVGENRGGDHCIAGRTTVGLAGPCAADRGLVGLHPLSQELAVGRTIARQIWQPGPGGLVVAEAHLPLQLHGRDAALARRRQPDRQKPACQAGVSLLEDGAGQQQMLLAAGSTLLDQPQQVAVDALVAKAGAAKALRPAAVSQIGPALRVGPEPRQKRQQIPPAGPASAHPPSRAPAYVLAWFTPSESPVLLTRLSIMER